MLRCSNVAHPGSASVRASETAASAANLRRFASRRPTISPPAIGRWTAAALAACLACGGFAVEAQDYPTKPVRIIVGQGAGGGVDTLTRLLGQRLSERLGQSVIVENKPGAGGVIGTGFVVKAPPDGYTLLMAPIGNIVFTQILYRNLPYSAQRDLTPIGMVATFPLVLVVNASSPYRTVQDLVAYMKAHPEKANYGGSGPAFQFATELFKIRTGTTAEFIQYKSTSEVITALIGGDLLLALADTGPAHAGLSDGRLRALAVTSSRRLPSLPEVPTMAEAGLPDLDIQYWIGLFAPTGVPPPIVKKLEAELIHVTALPEFSSRLAAIQVTAAGTGGSEFARVLAADLARWSAVAKTAGIQPND